MIPPISLILFHPLTLLILDRADSGRNSHAPERCEAAQSASKGAFEVALIFQHLLT
jgi:hypothetical protein